MKSTLKLRTFLLAIGGAMLATSAAQGQATYYWDGNDAAAGFGAAGGVWAVPTVGTANSGWSTSADGTAVVTGSSVITAPVDSVNFGNGATGLGAGTITVSGSVSAANMTFASGSGAIVLSGGTIALAADGVITVDNSTNTISSTLSGAANSFTKAGAGALVLSGASSYTGTTNIRSGTLTLNSATGSLSSASSLSFSGTGSFNMDNVGAITALSQSLGALTFGAGEGTVRTTRTAAFDQTINFASFAGRTAGAIGNFVNTGTNGPANGFVFSAPPVAGTLIDRGVFYNGSSYAAYDVLGFVRGLAYGSDLNTAAADTIIASNHVKLTSSPATRAGDTLLSLNLSGSGVDYTMSSGTLTVPGILKSGGGSSTISGGAAVAAGGGAELVIRTDLSTDLLTISTPVTGGASPLTKSGAGTLTLTSSNNTYTGATTITAGTLEIGGFGLLNNGAYAGDIAIGGGATLLHNSAATQTLSGVISGAGGLTKSGPGVLTLTKDANSYTGPTIVTGGVLIVGTAWNGGSQSIPGGIGAATGGSNLELNGGNVRFAYYFRRTLGAGPGQFQITGGTSGFSHTQGDTYGRLSINNNVNYEVVWGSDHFKPDVLVLNEGIASPTQVVNFQNKLDLNGATRTVATNATNTVPGAYVKDANGFMTTTGGRITGIIRNSGVTPAGLTKTGIGELQLTNVNTYDGPTTISAGNLRANSSNALGNGSSTNTLIFDGGSLQADGNITSAATRGVTLATNATIDTKSYAVSIAGDVAGTGGLTKEGTGTLTLSGSNTYDGATTINGGNLEVGSTGTINSTSGIWIASGAGFSYNNTSTALTVAPTFNGNVFTGRSVFGGSGIIDAALTLGDPGDTLSPGNSPGTMAFATGQTWSSFSYDWEMNSWSSAVAGTNFDQITIVGALNLSGAADSYLLNILSLTAGDISGDVPDFAETGMSRTILTTTGGITGFAANKWQINPDGFSNTELGSWALAQDGNNLVLSYAPVPEPSAALLGALGAMLLLRRRR